MVAGASNLDRIGLLARLFPRPYDTLFVSGLAGSAWDAAELTGDGANLYTMAGTMGATVSMGLGVALAAPDAQVAVITGDGELLMNVGALATVANQGPANLSIVCMDNGRHGETGGQKSMTAGVTDLAAMAAGAGIANVATVSDRDGVAEAAAFLAAGTGPRFLCCRVMPGPPADYKRDLDPAACRLRFRHAYLGG
jgi:phosphonopyruvate decarboxylase